MEKLKQLLARLGELLSKDAGQRDEKTIAEVIGQITGLAASGGLETREVSREVQATMQQLRKDLDAQATTLRDLQRMGLTVRAQRIVPLGRTQRLEMLADGKAFAEDESARRFGAYCAHRMFGPNAGEALPKLIYDIAKDVLKADDVNMELTPTGGAAFMPDEFRAELIRNVEATGRVFPLCRRVPLFTMGQTSWPRHTGGLTAYPTAVAAKIAKSAPTSDTVPLTPVKWATLTGVPGEFFRSPALLIALGQYLGIEITYALADAFDGAVVNGDGSADFGGITGLRQSANIAAVTALAAHDLGTEIDGTDVSNVIGGLTKEYALENARWFMSLSMVGLCRALKSTTGQPLYQRGGNGMPNTIDDFPFVISNKFPAKGSVTASTLWCAFGDLQRSHIFGMVGNIRIDQSDGPYFDADMTAVRGIAEVDCQETDATAIVTGKSGAGS